MEKAEEGEDLKEEQIPGEAQIPGTTEDSAGAGTLLEASGEAQTQPNDEEDEDPGDGPMIEDIETQKIEDDGLDVTVYRR